MVRRHNMMFYIFLFLWCTLTSNPISLAGNPPETSEPIETLEVIEVTGATVTKASITYSFPLPSFEPSWPTTTFYHHAVPDLHFVDLPQPPMPRILLDQIGTTRGRKTSVKPLKTERPLYPRMAREQGWQGKVVLRTQITADGIVKNATVQESSGFSLLDESAVQSVKSWLFEPAKNGEFAVASTVDLPIRFDLLQ
ncbi:energy transducer TonB [Candidatus Nitrospira allomarina]|uniref:Energy transducer TonB n=1 Tax=Candidatus Nitrospira allomarina TaxID=3020900 RepID=A0AA96GIZ1_9BACT|nr:energy transducer TonB [Candidatus Nitrospira allomarina]WNM59823.1 energy transducer TonB [Candidatus Nitrospira allomarina]